MTIQPVKVQPSQMWHVKQCKSKVHSKRRHVLKSNRTIVLQRNHTSTKRKKSYPKSFLHIIPPIQKFHSLFSQNSKNKNIRSLLLRSF